MPKRETQPLHYAGLRPLKTLTLILHADPLLGCMIASSINLLPCSCLHLVNVDRHCVLHNCHQKSLALYVAPPEFFPHPGLKVRLKFAPSFHGESTELPLPLQYHVSVAAYQTLELHEAHVHRANNTIKCTCS